MSWKWLLNITLLLLTLGKSVSAQSFKEDTARVRDLLNQGQEIYINQPSEAKQLWEEGLSIIKGLQDANAHKAKDSTLLAMKSDLCFNLNQVCRSLGETDQTVKYLKQALKIDEALGNKEYMSSSYNDLGVIYNDIGMQDEALEFYMKSLSIDRELENQQGISASLINIGYLHNKQRNFEESLECFNESLKIQKEIGDTLGMLTSMGNIATVLNSMKQNDEALKLSKEVSRLALNANLKPTLAGSYSRQAKVFESFDMLDSAEHYYLMSYQICDTLKDKDGIVSALIGLAEVKYKLEEYNDSELYAKKAYMISDTLKFVGMTRLSSIILSNANEKLGNAEAALSYLKEYNKLSEDLLKDSHSKNIFKHQLEDEYQVKRLKDSLVNVQAEESRRIQAQLDEEIIKRNQFYVYLALVGLALLSLFAMYLFRTNQKRKLLNAKIESQKREVEDQKALLENQHLQLEITHRNISDSILYAKRLQQAIIPKASELKDVFKDVFVIFKPKDVVSGDFYWLDKTKDASYFAIADCTGHGVPGALVSVVCSNAFDQAVKEHGLTQPGEILDKTRALVIDTFSRSGMNIKDGMDTALLKLEKNKLTFSGANHNVLVMRSEDDFDPNIQHKHTVKDGKVIIELKGDRQPIGLTSQMTSFNEVEFDLLEGDAIYLTTDGFIDQFGGQNGKKLKLKNLLEMLFQNYGQSMAIQKENLSKSFDDWKGDIEQIDDVCLIGLKVS